MLGAPPALANTRFPVASSDVIGREPLEARAIDKNPEQKEHLTSSWRSQTTHQQSSTQQQSILFTDYILNSNAPIIMLL